MTDGRDTGATLRDTNKNKKDAYFTFMQKKLAKYHKK